MDQVTKTSPFKYPAVNGTKRCTKCLNDLPLSQFGMRVQRGKRGFQSQCTPCRNARRRLANRGLTAPELQRMLDEQQGRCFLCNSKEVLKIDHNHTTGRVRKLLCNTCNWRIGMLESVDETWLKKALSYISDL